MPIDEKALNQFLERAVTDLSASYGGVMVSLGNKCGMRTRAILTNMDQPLGQAAGNWLEIKEAVTCLEGAGPKDLEELVVRACLDATLRVAGLDGPAQLGRDRPLR